MGSTGHRPVPSGDPPGGTAATPPTKRVPAFSNNAPEIPVGESPTGTGGSRRATQHDLTVRIEGKSFVAPIGFSAQLGVPFNLLGWMGVFEHFKIYLHEKRKVVSFQAVD